MFCLVLCCRTLEMDQKSTIGLRNVEKDQVDCENTWPGAITFEIGEDERKNEQRVHIFNRMETEECYMKLITPCYIENNYANDVVADLDYSRNLLSKELIKKLGVSIEEK